MTASDHIAANAERSVRAILGPPTETFTASDGRRAALWSDGVRGATVAFGQSYYGRVTVELFSGTRSLTRCSLRLPTHAARWIDQWIKEGIL